MWHKSEADYVLFWNNSVRLLFASPTLIHGLKLWCVCSKQDKLEILNSYVGWVWLILILILIYPIDTVDVWCSFKVIIVVYFVISYSLFIVVYFGNCRVHCFLQCMQCLDSGLLQWRDLCFADLHTQVILDLCCLLGRRHQDVIYGFLFLINELMISHHFIDRPEKCFGKLKVVFKKRKTFFFGSRMFIATGPLD